MAGVVCLSFCTGPRPMTGSSRIRRMRLALSLQIIAALAVTISGFALNAIPDPRAFSGIDPCGIRGALPDFLLSEVSQSERQSVFEALPVLIAEQFRKS